MGQYASLFKQVGNSKVMTTWEPRLPVGTHLVAMVKYGGKASGKNPKDVFLEGEFIVLESNNEEALPGALHSWMWAIHKPDDFGYVFDRARRFVECVQECTGATVDENGDPVSPEAFGDALDEDFRTPEPNYYGVMLRVNVDAARNSKTGAEIRSAKSGEPVLNAEWTAVSQDEDDVTATRARLKELASAPKRTKPARPATTPAPETDRPIAAEPEKKLAGLGRIGLGKRP